MINWRIIKLKDISKIYDGTHQTPDYVETGVPFYSVEQVTANQFTKTKFITEDVYERETRRVKIERGDILMTRIGDIGTARYIDWEPRASFYVSLALIKPFNAINGRFLSYAISAHYFQKELWQRSLTVAFPYKINLGDIGRCALVLPEIPEQERIAAVLMTWDEYIERLEQKIALKKQLQYGLMQQLLTGKRRLPGFGSEWQTIKLGEISKIKTGSKDNQNKVVDGTYPFFVRSPRIERINSYSFDGEAILVPGEGNIGKIFHYINGRFDYHQRVYGITHFAAHVSGRYIYYYFVKNFARQAERHSVKATVDSLRLPTFSNFLIHLPNREEQLAIVNVIDNLTSEIELLQSKMNMVNDQKKYLLNKLITGAIRTPENLQPKGVN